jgi:hypothetical protein
MSPQVVLRSRLRPCDKSPAHKVSMELYIAIKKTDKIIANLLYALIYVMDEGEDVRNTKQAFSKAQSFSKHRITKPQRRSICRERDASRTKKVLTFPYHVR